MKIGNFEISSKKKIDINGNQELAKNKEIYGVLSDPEFIKTFPGPADFQYDLIRESLISSKENAINGIAYLKDYIKTSDNPLFCLVRLSQFLHTAIGNQKSLASSKEQKEISEILEKGFKDISSDDETKYFLGVNLNPDIIFKQTQSFEGQERGLTPIQVSEGYFVQDNGFDPIPTFYHTDNPKDFNSIIEEQKKFFQSARPENRPEMPKNPTLKEMIEYKKKYLDPTINFSEIKKEIREKINKSTNRLSPEEIQKFFPSSHNTFELTQDPLMFEFRAFINPEIRSIIEKEFGVDLKEIPLKEQIYFLTSITNRTNKTIKPVLDFTKKFKGFGLRTFLSIEHGGKEMGDKIITLGEKLPEESARILFEKYGEIIDEVDNIGGYIEKSVKGKVSPLIIEKAKENLLIKGKDLLNSYAVKADTCNGEECLDIGRELEDKLSNIKASLLLFASACKSLSENGEISLDDLANTELEVVRGLSVDEKTQEEMKIIFRENRPNYPDKLLKDVSKEFEDNIKNIKENQTFYILKNNGDITSFMRLDEEDGFVYGASFNVRTELRGSAIGSELLKKIIEIESQTKPFKIICYEKNPMLEKYQSNFGFEIVGTIENYHNTGERFYEMTRNPV